MSTLKRVLLVLCITLVSMTYVYAQADPLVLAATFPPILWIAYFAGILVHWFKKYMTDGVTLNFWRWLIVNISWTIGSVVAGVSAVLAIFASTPAAFIPVSIGSYIIVFTTAMAADTINSAGTKSGR